MPTARRRKAPSYLMPRGRKWYAVMAIPLALRPRFGGKVRFVQALGTESYSVAQNMVHDIVAAWKRELTEDQWPSIVTVARGKRHSRPILPPTALFLRLRAAKTEDERAAILDEIERGAWLIGAVNVENVGDPPSRDPEARHYYAVATGEYVQFAEHLEAWLAAWQVAQKTKDMARADATTFAKKFPTVQSVTRKDVKAWTADRIASGVSPATVQRNLTALRTYWRYMQTSQVIGEDINPFDGLRMGAKVNRSRKPFEPRDVVKLWQAASDDPPLADLIRMAAYTGARIEELCALKVADVARDHFTIREAKTEAGRRQVPIHRELTRTMVRLKKASSDGYILSRLPTNKYGDRSNAIGKRFGRLKTDQGFGPEHVFHYFRRTVITMLERAGVPESTVQDIVGHERSTLTGSTYSGKSTFEMRRAALAKLRYPASVGD